LFLQGYIDDSDDSGNPDSNFTLAGFIAPIEVWKDFSANWIIARRGHPKIDYYKTNDALGFKGDFEGWSEADRNAKLVSLSRVILDSKLVGIHTSVPKGFHRAVFDGKRFEPAWNSPYHISAVNLVIMAHEAILSDGDKIDFVFDQQGSVGKNFKTLFDGLLKKRYPRLGYCFHVDDRDFPPLQAADMNAAFVRRSSLQIQPWVASDVYMRVLAQEKFDVTHSFLQQLRQFTDDHPDEANSLR
jgi:hypothetical protein